MTAVVSINQVIASGNSYPRTIRRMEDVLRKQGQIEPLQVKKHCLLRDGTQVYMTFDQDVYGADIVNAARSLGWPTLLIVEMEKYEH